MQKIKSVSLGWGEAQEVWTVKPSKGITIGEIQIPVEFDALNNVTKSMAGYVVYKDNKIIAEIPKSNLVFTTFFYENGSF